MPQKSMPTLTPKTVSQEMGMDLTRDQFRTIFDYLFYKINNAQFRAVFAPLGLERKRVMDRSGYILINCKLYAYACHTARVDGRQLPRAATYDISVQDAKRLRHLDLTHIDPKHGPSHTIAQFQADLAFLYGKDIDNHIGRFTSKKHRFLIKSYGESRDDIRQRLRTAALYALYRRYPFFENRMHQINVAKAAIHDSGQDLIKEHTCKSRQRMLQNPDGTYSHAMVPYDSPGLQVPAASEPDTFVKDSLQALCRIEHRLTLRARRFLWVLSGQHDPKFSIHLGRDNSELAERVQFTTYQSKVRRYFGVKQGEVDEFFLKLRTRSGWESRSRS